MMRYDRATAISKRHTQLLELVKSSSHSPKSLAERLGVSAPTVYRDVVFLRRQGHTIEPIRLSSNWVYQLASQIQIPEHKQGER